MGHVAHRAATIRLAVLCSILNKIWDLAPPLLIGVAVDVVVTQEDSLLASLGIVDPWHQLLVLAAVTVAIWALESLFEYWYGVLWRNLAQSVQHDVRMATLNACWVTPHRGLMNGERATCWRSSTTTSISSNASSTRVQTTCCRWGPPSSSLARFSSPSLGKWPCWPSCCPAHPVGLLRYQRALEPKYLSVRDAAGDLNALLENDIGGMTTIQSFTAERIEAGRLTDLSEAYRARNREASGCRRASSR